jgi:hypothetical protein
MPLDTTRLEGEHGMVEAEHLHVGVCSPSCTLSV